MSVARVPDSRRLQSIFVIVEYIRLSNTSHFPHYHSPPQPFPPHDIFTFSHIPPITISPPITTSPPQVFAFIYDIITYDIFVAVLYCMRLIKSVGYIS